MSRAPGDELPGDQLPGDGRLGGDAGLAQTWREASREEPPPALDDAIRAAARKAVHARPRAAAGSPFGGRWRVPLSVAAVLVVSATITLLVAERDRHGSGPLHDQAVPPPALPEPEARTDQPTAGPSHAPARAAAERSAPGPVAGMPREQGSSRMVESAQVEHKAISSAPQPPLASAQKPRMRAQPAEQPARQMSLQEAAPAETDQRQGQRAETQQSEAGSVAPAAAPPMRRADDALRDRGASEEAAKLTKREAEPVARAKEGTAARAPAAPTTMEAGAQDAPASKSEPRAFPAAAQSNASAQGAVAADTESLEPKAWLDRILELRRQGKREEAAKSLKAFRERYPAYPLPDELKSSP